MSTDIFIRYFLHLHADIAIIDAKGVCKFMAYDNDLIAGKLRRWEKYLELTGSPHGRKSRTSGSTWSRSCSF